MTADLFALNADAQDLLFREAHTAKKFTDEPVSDEQVAAIYDLIKWGPTMTNSQRCLVAPSAIRRKGLLGALIEVTTSAVFMGDD